MPRERTRSNIGRYTRHNRNVRFGRERRRTEQCWQDNEKEEFSNSGFDTIVDNYSYPNEDEVDQKELITKIDISKIKQECDITDDSMCNETYVKTEPPDDVFEELEIGNGFEEIKIKEENVSDAETHSRCDTEALQLEELIIKTEDAEASTDSKGNESMDLNQHYNGKRRRRRRKFKNLDKDYTAELTPYRCWVCEKEFNRKRNFDAHNLKYHTNRAHSVTSKVHYCEECDYKTVHKTHLKLHMHQHSPNVQRFSCHNCPYTTHDKSNLKRHMLTHTRNKRFPCRGCNKIFNSKKELDAHVLGIHSEDEELVQSISYKIHTCKYCDYRCIQMSQLIWHVKSHKKIK